MATVVGPSGNASGRLKGTCQVGGNPHHFFFFFINLGLELNDTQSTSLKYEPSLELLLITAKHLFLNRKLHRTVQLCKVAHQACVKSLSNR